MKELILSTFRCDALSGFVAGFIVLFTVLTAVYSWNFMKGRPGLVRYGIYLLVTLVASLATVFTKNWIVFLVFWGILGLLLLTHRGL